ncbi:hypothetical protein IGI04_010721 [Brassica rapa subsp. trilocularis]|uniref:DNA-(apurinic or apyrimidinic site) endonuclease n=1 Tax=Brassica rapa subsp. trilocularis TaxID=1813537 RepID=A0ABQ7N154_BRACM|nr:hypothetical protein IGI04_010721 [Brassica rapa subsp. trilocularis]
MNKVLQFGLHSSKFLAVPLRRSLRFGSSIVSVSVRVVGTTSFNKRLMSNATTPFSINNNTKGKEMMKVAAATDHNCHKMVGSKDDQKEIEAMTVQELRATLRQAYAPFLCYCFAYNPKTMRLPPLPEGTKSVKIMTWNVNGLRALLKLESFSALQLAQRENFDVLCLQETKIQVKDVEEVKKALSDGYDHSFWSCSVSKLGYSGTAIISRIKPLSVRYGTGLSGSDHDMEGRIVTTEFDSFYLISTYVPNSGDGLKRLSYRIEEGDRTLSKYIKELEKTKPVVLTGDLNCAHEEIDIYNPAGNKRSAGFTIEERQSFRENFLDKGLVDTFRKQHPGVVGYTYWGYRHGTRKTNKGWRLDYFLVSESIVANVHDSYILPDINGSDHCPIGLILKL